MIISSLSYTSLFQHKWSEIASRTCQTKRTSGSSFLAKASAWRASFWVGIRRESTKLGSKRGNGPNWLVLSGKHVQNPFDFYASFFRQNKNLDGLQTAVPKFQKISDVLDHVNMKFVRQLDPNMHIGDANKRHATFHHSPESLGCFPKVAYPLVIWHNYEKSQFFFDRKTHYFIHCHTISMAVLNSYFDITRGYWLDDPHQRHVAHAGVAHGRPGIWLACIPHQGAVPPTSSGHATAPPCTQATGTTGWWLTYPYGWWLVYG